MKKKRKEPAPWPPQRPLHQAESDAYCAAEEKVCPQCGSAELECVTVLLRPDTARDMCLHMTCPRCGLGFNEHWTLNTIVRRDAHGAELPNV